MRTIKRYILGPILLCLFQHAALATIDPPLLQVLYGSNGDLVAGKKVTVEDLKYSDVAYSGKRNGYASKNRVSFKIDEASSYYLQGAFNATVQVRIKSMWTNGTTSSEDKTLFINYNTGSPYFNTATYVFDNAWKVEVEVLSVSSNVAWSVWPALVIENEITPMPTYRFPCDTSAIQSISVATLDSTTTADEIGVSWGAIIGADEYDLEWAYIDSSALKDSVYGDPQSPTAGLIFADNASRVTITTNSYNIPLMYDGKGTLFVRVRPVQVHSSGGRKEANWSTNYTGGLGKFRFIGHQRALNWQATTSFAEDGKRKTVVQYFDGSLRGRQTVTKDNTTNRTIVAESIYDYQGRPVIQVLPAPTLDSVIKYSHNFNLGLNGAYDKEDFDVLADPADYCDHRADSMVSTSGAAKYYSPNNPLRDSGFHKFIPKANGYPFAQVEYTPDNTGRISKQGGVDSTFQLGFGRETRYFYGTPDQNELDALFGTEAGHFSHYFKTMVRDANGQYSVSYADMHGRTIATALAGRAAEKLDNLPSNVSDTLVETLADSSSAVIKDLSIESKKGLLVPVAGLHTFTYSLNAQSLQMEGCTQQVCYDCLYNLTITITDDCNNQKLGGQAFDTTIHNFSLGSIDTSCSNAAGGFSFSFTKYLAEGSYEVTKKLSISRAGMSFYRDSLFLVKNACKSIETFIQEQRDIWAAKASCKPSCESCMTSLGTWTSFKTQFFEASGLQEADTALAWKAYEQALADCKVLCDSTSETNDIRRSMLLDMMPPSGQYADTSHIDVYSIFHYGIVPGAAPYHRIKNYTDEFGRKDSVYDESAGKYLYPHELSRDAFVQKFKMSWADSLLQFHPEYCKLTKYEAEPIKSSTEWDRRFERTDNFRDAMAKGYLNPTNNSSSPFNRYNPTSGSPDFDPLAVSPYKTGLEANLLEYRNNNIGSSAGKSMWGLATAMIMCPKGANADCYNTWTSNSNAFDSTAMCEGELDMAWRAFRQMYLDIKREQIYAQINSACPGTPTATQLVTSGHNVHFSIATELSSLYGQVNPSDTAAAAAQGQAAINAYYDATCRGYVTTWWRQLAPCGLDSTDSLRLMPRMVQICKEGSDETHPYGSSSVKPSSTQQFKSFEQLLKHYCDSMSIDYNSACNAYLITTPRPYDQQQAYVKKPLYAKPDSCECSQVSKYYQDYLQFKRPLESFSGYVLRATQVSIPASTLDSLRQLCNGDINCRFLPSPLTLPEIFQCGIKNICVPCIAVDTLYTRFKTEFPGVIPVYEAADTLQRRYNILFENFMNTRLGFSKHAVDYLKFMDTCQINFSGSCDSLRNFVRDYNRNYNSGRVLHRFGTEEAEEFNDLSQLIVNGAIQLPDTVRQRPGSWYNPYELDALGGNFCMANGYTIESRFRFLQNDNFNGHVFFLGFRSIDLLIARYPDSVNSIYGPGLYLIGAILYSYDGTEANNEYYGAGYGGAGFDYIQLSGNPDALLDWMTFKARVTPTHYYVYYNGALVYDHSRNAAEAITPQPNFGWGFRGRHGSIDYIKISDSSGVVKYFEPFNNPVEPALVDPSFICPAPDCPANFANRFNLWKGTSYTYAQIDSIYAACGIALNVCNPDTDTAVNTVTSPLLCGKVVADIPFDVNSVDNCSDSTFIIISTATELYKAYLDSLKNKFDSAYAAKCLAAYKLEKFTVKHLASEFHYTLYYYDQAGNLVKTVPPQGVQVNRDSLWLDSVRTARRLGQEKLPAHTLATQYRYNTLNQVVAQHSPDGGKTEFWYDRLGRLVLSSNAKQKAAGSGENGRLYSYTLYDELGRITEVGQVSNTTANGAATDSITRNESLLSTWYYSLANRRGQITSTVYDVAYTGFGSPSPLVQRNLRNRVSYTTYTDTATLSSFNNGTFFTYDIHGNVDTLLQHYGNKLVSGLANVMNKNNNGYKKIVYKYDLISGKVNLVAYNPHNIDEFYHRYTYDAENRLTLAETSTDSIHWEKEARYEYYRHGPLARTILGDQQVQGMDYAYTLQGWLKGVNSISLSANFDMGGDGKTGGINQPVAKDEVGFNLSYYTGDYLPVNATVNPFPTHTAAGGLAADDNRPLYNGNISSMAVNIKKLIYPGVAAYHYDQLNRITARKSYFGLDQTNNNWNGLTATKSFEEKFSYDANGNILTADRYTGATWGFMDSLTYSYYPGTNKLRRVRDFGFTMYGFNPPDIADQSATDNYTYDEIGNLTSDAQEGITNIKWSVYGKILEINRTASTYNPVIKIRYGYDAAGNRISKEVQKNGTDTVEYSWYVRDAQGNIMSTYTAIGDTTGIGLNGLTLNIMDQPLYGSSRLGVLTRQATAEDSWYPFNDRSKIRGLKQYELSNHLGNVLATVSDRKTPVQSGSDPTKVDHFDAEVQNAFDYYAFGMVMPDRKFTGPAYRFGFNGKENDGEVKGVEGTQQDYGMRIYDPRLGRFLSVDPLTGKYPELTPYQFSSNNPITLIDLDGGEGKKPEAPPATQAKIGNIIRGQGYGLFGLNTWPNLTDEGRFIDEATTSSGSNFGYSAWWRLAHNIALPSYVGALGVTGEGIAANGEWQYFKAYNVEATRGRTPPVASISFHNSFQSGTYDFRINVMPMVGIQLRPTFNNADGSNQEIKFNVLGGETLSLLYEVKTVSPNSSADIILGYIRTGVNQTIDNIKKNPNVANTKTAGILLIDKSAYLKAYNEKPAEVKSLIDGLQKSGGYLKLGPGLFTEAKMFVDNITKEIKNETSSN